MARADQDETSGEGFPYRGEDSVPVLNRANRLGSGGAAATTAGLPWSVALAPGAARLNQTTDDPAKDGIVLAEKPTAGTRASRGSSVSITVGRYQSG
jgi:hypothetical protein